MGDLGSAWYGHDTLAPASHHIPRPPLTAAASATTYSASHFQKSPLPATPQYPGPAHLAASLFRLPTASVARHMATSPAPRQIEVFGDELHRVLRVKFGVVGGVGAGVGVVVGGGRAAAAVAAAAARPVREAD